MNSNSKIYIRECLEIDIDILQKIGYETYDETFRQMNTAKTMEAYLSEAFDRDRVLSELKNSGSTFYFISVNDALAGYLKLNTTPAQSDINDIKSLEIERIYIKKRFKGKGLGKKLIVYALDAASEMGKSYAWLGVWEKNIPAIAFYEKMGFKRWKKHSFKMGSELQSDLLLRRFV